uniref:C2 domain-containing protein n=1 Tax=Parascaris equorum TaxID=6256 RepID=A0A914R1P2_PAREQ
MVPYRQNREVGSGLNSRSTEVESDRSRTFVTHWRHGAPADVTLSCEVAGVDPTYGFPRTCDSTANIRMFRKTVDEEFVSLHYSLITLPSEVHQ